MADAVLTPLPEGVRWKDLTSEQKKKVQSERTLASQRARLAKMNPEELAIFRAEKAAKSRQWAKDNPERVAARYDDPARYARKLETNRIRKAALAAANPPKPRGGPRLNPEQQAASKERERQRKADWRQENLERLRQMDAKRRAKMPEAYAAYHREWYETNKGKTQDKQRLYYRANDERIRARTRKYAAENPDVKALSEARRRAKKRGSVGSFTREQVKEIYRLQRGRCAYCRCKLNFEDIRRDHIVSLAKGGSNHARNIQVTCEPCNASKSSKDPIEFARQIGLLL